MLENSQHRIGHTVDIGEEGFGDNGNAHDSRLGRTGFDEVAAWDIRPVELLSFQQDGKRRRDSRRGDGDPGAVTGPDTHRRKARYRPGAQRRAPSGTPAIDFQPVNPLRRKLTEAIAMAGMRPPLRVPARTRIQLGG